MFAFEDSVCSNCYENQKDGGGLKKILIGIIASILSFFGYGEYSELKNQNLELQNKLGAIEEQIRQPILGGGPRKRNIYPLAPATRLTRINRMRNTSL